MVRYLGELPRSRWQFFALWQGRGVGADAPRTETRSPDEVAAIMERVRSWLDEELAWALSQTDVVQVEIHFKGDSVRPRVSAIRQGAI